MSREYTIKSDDWLEELQRLSRRSDSGQTAQELADAAGMGLRATMLWLKKAADLGWLSVGKRSILRIDGRPNVVPVYLIRKPAPKAARKARR